MQNPTTLWDRTRKKRTTLRNVVTAAVCGIVLSAQPLSVAAQTVLPMPPAAKPDPNAPAAPPADAIENLLDREPEPLFSDNTLVPYAPAFSSTQGTSEGLSRGALYLMAKLTRDSEPLDDDLVWRIYSDTTNTDGRLQLIATSKGGDAEFRLNPGTYMIHTAYGYAQATNRIVIGKEVLSKMVTLNAGGIKFGASLPDGAPLASAPVVFDIYSRKFDERGERDLIASGVEPGAIIRLSADTYHIVSRYGNANAEIRADIQVLPGKLTEANIFHKAADITLKLVNARGGEAIANTTWSVLSPGGDIVVEAAGAFPDFVLASGDYEAIARNGGRTYLQTFKVSAGEDREVEVVMSDSELITSPPKEN